MLRLAPTRVVGLDISPKMIELARKKVAKQGVADIIELQVGDSEKLPFADVSFDAVTVGFGVRNF